MLKYFNYNITKYNFTIVEDNGFIVEVSLGSKEINGEKEETKLIKQTKNELEEYFQGQRTTFDIPLKLTGTPFQNKVWMRMQQIPFGEVLSYKELAESINNPKALRAVGNACHNNKILILIPCHRVVAKNSLGGFGCGLDMKIDLLKLERKSYNGL